MFCLFEIGVLVIICLVEGLISSMVLRVLGSMYSLLMKFRRWWGVRVFGWFIVVFGVVWVVVGCRRFMVIVVCCCWY